MVGDRPLGRDTRSQNHRNGETTVTLRLGRVEAPAHGKGHNGRHVARKEILAPSSQGPGGSFLQFGEAGRPQAGGGGMHGVDGRVRELQKY